MSINFIPNDPLAIPNSPMRIQAPRPNRPSGVAGFNVSNPVAEGQFAVGTTDFLFWQCREAVLATVECWESIDSQLTQWARSGRKLEVSTDFNDPDFVGAAKLNAFYDGAGLRFFIFDNGTVKTMSGISTETVSHETGHALLDTLRPELFQSTFPEVPAFHESFGDIIALLTTLSDKSIRKALLTVSAALDTANFVEASSEYLSDAIRKQFGNVAPSKPRRALNKFKWALPTTLPAGAFIDPPSLLSREPHSFSRVFTGCFYDVLRGIFTSMPSQNEGSLLQAAQTAGKLVIGGVRAAAETARYFRAVGRGMVLADDAQNGGANRQIINKAFEDHGIMLGTNAVLSPTAALAGPPPKISKKTAKLAPSTLSDLRKRIQAGPGARFSVNVTNLFADIVAEASHKRAIDLGQVDTRLRGAVAFASETTLVGASGAGAAIMSVLPEPNQTYDEVCSYVETLVKNDRIDFETGKSRGKTARVKSKDKELSTRSSRSRRSKAGKQPYTHALKKQGGKRVLVRLGFLCNC
jgi:hypothetical protein